MSSELLAQQKLWDMAVENMKVRNQQMKNHNEKVSAFFKLMMEFFKLAVFHRISQRAGYKCYRAH